MTRILQMVGSLNSPGPQTTIMDIYRCIDREKLQFDFVLDRQEEGGLVQEARAMGARIFTLPAFNGANAGEVKRDWNNFLYTHPEYKVLHSHVKSYAALYLPAAKKLGLKTIVHSYSAVGQGAAAMAMSAMLYPLKKQADILMAVSGDVGSAVYGDKAVKTERFMLMPRPVELKRFGFSEEQRRKCRKALGLEGRFVVGHIGPFAEFSNLGFLVEAFAALHEKEPKATLLLVGSGEQQRAVAMKAVELGVAEDVLLTGEREDIPELLAAMDIFALPGELSSVPQVLIEAQAASLPCLISESIGQAADISTLVTRLATDKAERWAKEMLKKPQRRDVSENIIRAGLDSRSCADSLLKLYGRLQSEATR